MYTLPQLEVNFQGKRVKTQHTEWKNLANTSDKKLASKISGDLL